MRDQRPEESLDDFSLFAEAMRYNNERARLYTDVIEALQALNQHVENENEYLMRCISTLNKTVLEYEGR